MSKNRIMHLDKQTCFFYSKLSQSRWFRPLLMLPGQFNIVVDVGAYNGNVAIFARTLNPCAEIIVIEPSPPIFDVLQKSIQGMNISAHKLALGDGKSGVMASNSVSVKNRFLVVNKTDNNTITCDSMPLSDMVYKLTSFNDQKSLYISINCEGGEACIFNHEPSLQVISLANMLTIQCHGRSIARKFRQLVEKRFNSTHIAREFKARFRNQTNFTLVSKKMAKIIPMDWIFKS